MIETRWALQVALRDERNELLYLLIQKLHYISNYDDKISK